MSKKTQIVIRVILVVGTFISMFYVPWLIIWAWILPLPDTIQEQAIEALDHGFEGIVVYVDEAGKPPAFYAAGWKDRELKIPADPHALFKIASIGKLYTAVAITKLVTANRLSLDNTVADYFPELANRIEYSDQITLRLIIQHRSGIPNFTDSPGFWGNPPESTQASLELILDSPASFVPGEDYEYSNTNYLLLSELIKKTLGYSEFQFIKEEILIPLGLKNTYASLQDVKIDDVMSGYHVGHPYDLKNDENGMLATAEDVGIFLRALNDGSIFSGDEAEIYASIYEYEHGGWVPGYQSLAEYHEDIDTVVIQFTSTTDSKLYLWNVSEIIINRIVDIIRNQNGQT